MAIRIIDNKDNPRLEVDCLSNLYRLTQSKERRAEHLSVMMYRLSKRQELLEKARPNVHLRNNNKVNFKGHKRGKEKYLKSPLSRGSTMWDQIPETKVNNEGEVEEVHSTTFA